MTKSTAILATSIFLFDHATAAISINDSGFNQDPVASVGGVDSTETDSWHRNGNASAAQAWMRTTAIVGPSGVTEGIAKYNDGNQNGTDSRALMQVITGAGAESGMRSLTFSYLFNDADPVNDYNLKLRVEVFGIPSGSWTTGSFDLAMANNNADVSPEDDAGPGPFTLLLNESSFTKTSDTTITGSSWRTASFDIDLGTGYDQLGIRFTASDGGISGTAANTVIAVDNVAIVPEPACLVLGMLGLGFLAARRRR